MVELRPRAMPEVVRVTRNDVKDFLSGSWVSEVPFRQGEDGELEFFGMCRLDAAMTFTAEVSWRSGVDFGSDPRDEDSPPGLFQLFLACREHVDDDWNEATSFPFIKLDD